MAFGWDDLLDFGLNAGASLIGGAISSGASKDAARMQQAGADRAIGEQRRQFDLTRGDLQPWQQAGTDALGRLRMALGLPGQNGQPQPGGAMGALEMDPGYQFRMDEGQKAIERSAAARGNQLSGATMKALTRFGQDYASNEYGNVVNRLAGLSGTGQTTANQMGMYGANMAGNVGNLYTQSANAGAAGRVGSGNAFRGAIDDVSSYYRLKSLL